MKKAIFGMIGVAVAAVSASAQVFSTGVITNNSFLALAGPPSAEVYGVNFGGTVQDTTANGYVFEVDPNNGATAPVSYAPPSNAQIGAPTFLPGGTSGDAALDNVLGSADVPGPTPGPLFLGGLTVGVTYNLLVIEADARVGVGNRTISITDQGVTSPSQAYAFVDGDGGVGGYILETFTATNSIEMVENDQPNGAQLNGILLAVAGSAPSNPTLAITNSGGGTVTLTITGTPAVTYRLLASSDMTVAVSNWPTIGSQTLDGTGIWQFVDTNNLPARYYRVVTP